MHKQLTHQEVARIRYAEVLREAARRPVEDHVEVETRVRRLPRVLGMMRNMIDHVPWHVPQARVAAR